jgi:hypothetical protein
VISGSGSGVGSGAGGSGSGVGSGDTTGAASAELGSALDSPGTVTGGPDDTAGNGKLAVLLGGVAWFSDAAQEVISPQASTAAAATILAANGRRTVMSLTVPAFAYYCCP